MEVSARAAHAGDVDRLEDLADAAVAELTAQRGGPVWSRREAPAEPRAELLAALDAADHLVVAGCIDEVVIGYGVVADETLHDGDRIGVISHLYTEPDARDVGVGEVMMDSLVAWCEERGCVGVDALALPGDRMTKNFFESFGLTARAITVHRPLKPAGERSDGGDHRAGDEAP